MHDFGYKIAHCLARIMYQRKLLLTNNFLLPYFMIWIGNNFHGGNAWRDHRRLESKSFYKSSGNILDSSRMYASYRA